MTWRGDREPVRTTGAAEQNRLTQAAAAGPYVAWRDAAGALLVQALGPRSPATIGRSDEATVTLAYGLVSREHAEVTVRVHGEPYALCVYLLDSASKHGTEHRTVKLEHGVGRALGPWHPVPRMPARPAQLAEGAHDVRLAGEWCLLVGGVPFDNGITHEREDSQPAPTVRERDVLVELCRPSFEEPDTFAPPPSNAEIAAAVTPTIGAERVSDLLSQMYVKYGLRGTKHQNRLRLVDLARRNHLVEIDDYR
jgi:hypothetical protein